MSRIDKDEFLENITLGFIPAGSGNGLVTCILKETEENIDVLASTFKIVKGDRMKIDLTELDLEYR